MNLIQKIGLKNARDMLAGYLSATVCLKQLQQDWDDWHIALEQERQNDDRNFTVCGLADDQHLTC